MPGLNEILTWLIYKLCAPKLIITLHQKIINKTRQEKVIDKRCVTSHFPCRFVSWEFNQTNTIMMQRTLIDTESKTQNAVKLDKAFCTIEGVRPMKKYQILRPIYWK